MQCYRSTPLYYYIDNIYIYIFSCEIDQERIFGQSSALQSACDRSRVLWGVCTLMNVHYKNKNTPHSCEVEDFVETHFCKLCVTLRSRAYYWVCALIKDIGPEATPLGTTV